MEDVDAENLMDIIHKGKCRSLELAMESLAKGDQDWCDYYNRDADYIESLKKKMLNTRSKS
jgi:hypothetical protein